VFEGRLVRLFDYSKYDYIIMFKNLD
jgi:hypothetical protein